MENSRQTIHSLSYTAITSEISITVCPEFVDHHETQGSRADVVSIPRREELDEASEAKITPDLDDPFKNRDSLNKGTAIENTVSMTGTTSERVDDDESAGQEYRLGGAIDLVSDADLSLEGDNFEEIDLFESEDDGEVDIEDEEVELTYSEVETDVFRDQRKEEFAFTYNVTIRNDSSETVQLLERHWVINSGGALFAEVEGPGVVGVQPVLAPGEEFEYTSWCLIADPVGCMSGGYTFVNEEGDEFLVRIPEFDLVCPRSLH
jgi:ApaG protein